MFQRAQVVVIKKMDLAAAVEFDREAAPRNIRRVASNATILEGSAKTGQGIEGWYAYLVQTVGREPSLEVVTRGLPQPTLRSLERLPSAG